MERLLPRRVIVVPELVRPATLAHYTGHPLVELMLMQLRRQTRA